MNESKIGKGGFSGPKTVGRSKITRIDILIDKIEKGEPLIFLKGKDSVSITIDKNILDSLKEWDLEGSFELTPGYETKDLEKTSEFGGLDDVTSKAEAIQAIAVALALEKENLTPEDINIEDINNLKNISIGGKNTKESLIDWVKSNPNWMKSTINTANSLVKNKSYFSQPLSDYTSHWQDDFVIKIYNILKDIKTSSAGSIVSTMQSDKWNPSDMWVSTEKGRKTINSLSGIDDITVYNQTINDLFCRGDLIGISLKKSTKKEPEIKEFNTANCSIPQTIKLKDFKASPNIAGEKITIDFGGEEKTLNLRNFKTTTAFSGEMGGGEAAGGKVGIAAINAILDTLGMGSYKLPPSSSDTLKVFKTKDPNNPKLVEYKNKFKDLYTTHVGNNFDEVFNNASDAWKTGKFYALHFIDAMANAGDNQDDFISQVVRYGISGVKGISSAFIKSGN
tara:strand:- start:2125 stop:3477 length:1353 start_codon:yes stop_codon:yes gene_type:complete